MRPPAAAFSLFAGAWNQLELLDSHPIALALGEIGRLDSMAKQTRVAILADLFSVLGPHTRAKALSSIKLQEMANRLIDGGGFAALHQPGDVRFTRACGVLADRVFPRRTRSGTPIRAVDVSERAKLCRRGQGRWQRRGAVDFIPPGS
jgi:hypothetical protein